MVWEWEGEFRSGLKGGVGEDTGKGVVGSKNPSGPNWVTGNGRNTLVRSVWGKEGTVRQQAVLPAKGQGKVQGRVA